MTALPPDRRIRLTKLLGLLGSDHVGERANAGAMADKLLREAGLTWESLLGGAVTRDPPPAYDSWGSPPSQSWREMATAILATGRVTAWERTFCEDLLERWRGWDLTEKQTRVLNKIYAKRTGRRP